LNTANASDILYLNSQSLIKNYNEIKLLIEQKNPVLVCLSETRVTEEIDDNEIYMYGYATIRNNSHTRYTGGLVIFILDFIEFNVVRNEVYEDTWILSIEVKSDKMKSGIYTVIYRSPSGSKRTFLEYCETFFENIADGAANHIVTGDFNIDMSKTTSESNRLRRMITKNGLKQYVNEFTRVDKEHRTIIDLIISNDFSLDVCVLNSPKITDHAILKIKGLDKNEIASDKTKITLWKNYNKNTMLHKLNFYNWNEMRTMDFNSKANMIIEVLEKNLNELLETIEIDRMDSSYKKWYDNELRKTRSDRDFAYLKFYISDSDEDWENYKHLRNFYFQSCRRKEFDFNQQSIENYKSDPDMLWKNLKKIIKQKEKPMSTVIFDGALETDHQEIADKLNNYFINSITEINNNMNQISNTLYPFLNNPVTNETFRFSNIDMNELSNLMKNMKNKTSGVNNLNVNVIMDSMDAIGDSFLDLINSSLRLGCVPERWKKSTVVPIQKISGTKKCEEFRPINILPAYEKILETAVKNQFIQYLEENNILIDEQSGFRSQHSCETSLNLTLAAWKEMIEDSKIIVAVFLDFKRAFETIDRELLLWKMEQYGVKDAELEWFRSYLSDRSQETKFYTKVSEAINVKLGVPQGSVLGPLLFILYINDIKNSIKFCKVNLFADDTLLYIATDNLQDAVNKINEDLASLSTWLGLNKLKLNIQKTKYMVITFKQNVPVNLFKVNIDGNELELVEDMKYLGVIIDNKLKFGKNVQQIEKKIGKKINFIRRLGNKLNKHSKMTLYNAIIIPHFDYCSSILFLANEGEFNSLQKLQNRIMRTILKCRMDTPIRDMLQSLNLLSVKQRVTYNTMMLLYKMEKGLLPNYLCHSLNRVRNSHSHNTRSGDDFILPNFRKTSTQNSLLYNGMKIYNNIRRLDEFQNIRTMNDFQKICLCYVKMNF
jgi:hypothetical protein